MAFQKKTAPAQQTQQTQQAPTNNGPVFNCQLVKTREGKDGQDNKSFYTRIGVVWPTKNPNVFACVLDAIPTPTSEGYRFLLTVPETPEERAEREARNA